MRLITLCFISSTLLFTACSTTQDKPDHEHSAIELYQQAKTSLDNGDYETAINAFETLETRYPFGKYAQQAQLEIAYSYYKFQEPDSAIATLDRFTRNNPGNPHLDYAWYLKGLVNYSRGDSITRRLAQTDPADSDTRALRESFNDFTQLIKRYPDSKYSADAKKRLVFLHNNLAQYEIKVAQYYLKRRAWLAAANRARYVIENYQRTPAVQNALQILVTAYGKMDMPALAADAQRVLENNKQ
ncbi:MAG: outer membrane protein assembly factor BamD [Gammaproteobacteria bacterium]